ncbi:hypothetical protein BDN71DRAFT_599332 [Pleurotus eryngii]|uniref:Ricin B lectin domain-containing protein n=1 Tax=Pleurotus eryngii TaxID=5323 RepID=A0A9P5ZHY5_PLEER|nr:hypothetical protein BDN71DRAFT_599332 [Pleurotus eryngii]
MASIKNRTVLYLTSLYLLSGMVVLGKPLRRQIPSCTPGFSSDDPFDWNNSEPVGFSDGIKDGSGLIKARERGLFKFHKVASSSPTSFSITAFEDPQLFVGLRANSSLYLTKDQTNTRFIIDCGDCGSFVEDNCFMRLADKPDQCVQIGKGPQRGSTGEALTVVTPCKREDSQRFNFFKRVTPTSTTASSPSSTKAPWEHENGHSAPSQIKPSSVPKPTPSICNPTFDFEGVRVANSAVNWGAAAFVDNTDLIAERDFNKRLEIRFEQTGHPNPHYIAKSLNGTNLAIASRATNDNLYFLPIDEENNRKKFLIECASGCTGGSQVAPGGFVADGCVVKSQFNGKCVQVGSGPTAGTQGDRIFLNNCDGSDSQRFNFITSPFKTTGRNVATSDSDLAPPDAKVHLAGSGEGGDLDFDLKKLIRNSYIAIGLLAGVLLVLIVLGAMALARGCGKGRDSKPRYAAVSRKGDTDIFVAPRYSD